MAKDAGADDEHIRRIDGELRRLRVDAAVHFEIALRIVLVDQLPQLRDAFRALLDERLAPKPGNTVMHRAMSSIGK